MKIKFITSLFIFLLLPSNLFAKSACNLLYEELHANFTEYKLDFKPSIILNDFGFDMESRFNNQEGKWELDTDNDGYFKVGKITNENLINKVFTGDSIISANGIDLRKEKLSRKEDKYIQDLFDDNEEVNFVFKNSKKYNLSLVKTKNELSEPFTDITFKSISIDEKNNSFDAVLGLSFQFLYGSTDDYKDPLVEAATKRLMFESDGKKYTEKCYYSVDEWKSLRASDPSDGLEFLNLIRLDSDLIKSKYYLKPYSTEVADHVDLGWGNDLDLSYISDGIFSFRNNFDLRNFPFDKQTLEIYLVNRIWTINENILSVSDYSKRSLEDFVKQNDIVGWNIVGNNLSYEVYKGPNDVSYFDGVKFQLEIERKSSYYIFKIILPIVLILVVCWSSVWINPREIESRLTITIVCLLSLIAYNFVIDADMPKLEYLTIMDYVILISYIYATIPNFTAILSFNLIGKNKLLHNKIENYEKKFGLPSYIIIVFIIIIVNSSNNPEHASSLLTLFKP